jgi:competence protein ComEA
MEEESLHVRYLIVIAAVLCAVIIGYNAFYVPDASMSTITVTTDTSSYADEAYTPRSAGDSSAALGAVSSNAQKSAGAGSAKTVSGKVNINTATVQQLDELDGIGEVMAKRIVAYRGENGSFKSIDAVKNVSGIGDKIYAKIKDHITI